MDWKKLLNADRLKQTNSPQNIKEKRTQFQRDYDRIIFSSPFRRLQNKTQVFPLPDSVFVHNRLTHSMEVASVGRSMASRISDWLISKQETEEPSIFEELPTIISTACLCHDLGNPPFGHSGEEALSIYFKEGKGNILKKEFDNQQWADLCKFEGNANALRLLTQQLKGRREGGFVLTYATLSAIIKYPFNSIYQEKPKYGYFWSEIDTFNDIVNKTGLEPISESKFSRNPLVYMVEAADDISYLIMDMEDAHRLGILSFDLTTSYLTAFFENDTQFHKHYNSVKKQVTDKNELIAFLRSMVINKLVTDSVNVFKQNYNDIMSGKFVGTISDWLPEQTKEALNKCKTLSINKIYNHRAVIKIEMSGRYILGTLIEEFMNAIINPKHLMSKQLLSLIPIQYDINNGTLYEKSRHLLDFISGMTDTYAVQLYRDIRGIDFDKWPV